MYRSRVVIALASVIVAIVLQTTVFGAGRIQPFGVAPALVTLVIVLLAPYIEAEYHVMIGFTAGLLMDLMGSGTLGLWAMSMTVVAFTAHRVRQRFADRLSMTLVVAGALTFLGQFVFVVLGTLFGQGTMGEPGLIGKLLLPALWNVALAVPIALGFRLIFRSRDRSWAR